jgi:hypothetical protein
MSKKFTYDGKSRPVNNLYKENFDRIFKTNPVAKEVRTPKFKSKVIDSKKVYDRKKQQDELRESYEQSLKNKQDRKEKEKC